MRHPLQQPLTMLAIVALWSPLTAQTSDQRKADASGQNIETFQQILTHDPQNVAALTSLSSLHQSTQSCALRDDTCLKNESGQN